jgi:FtsP/CotA-like multicopper oxidase with cupredoxin domain
MKPGTPMTMTTAPTVHAQGHDHAHGAAGGIEWEDDMVEVNRLTTTANMGWKFVDRTSGADSPTIDWRFTVGERVKIRLVNEMDSDHPMHHPFHLHGAGRFLVLAGDGVVEPNLVWKDTVLIRTGHRYPFDVTNPGLWMAYSGPTAPTPTGADHRRSSGVSEPVDPPGSPDVDRKSR